MSVSRIELNRFMTHDHTVLELPPKGIITVIGPNGSGKSTLAEAVSVAVGGKTLRGTLPWRRDNEGSIRVTFPDVEIKRTRKGDRNGLQLTLPGKSKPESYETPTKAQDALEKLIGSWTVWRRTRAFSISDAANFTQASDGDRKRLLAEILGLDRFDSALKACRVALKFASESLTLHKLKLDRATTTAGSELRRLQESRESLAQVPSFDAEPAELKKKALKCKELVRNAEAEIEKLEADRGSTSRAEGAAQAKADEIDRKLRKLGDADECPTCEQDIPKALRTKLQKEAKSQHAAAKKESEAAEVAAGDVSEQLEELNEELHKLRNKYNALANDYRIANQVGEQRTTLDQRVADAEKLLEKAMRDREEHTKDVAKWDLEVKVLQAVERVLGLKGVRAHVLGRGLSGVEAMVNAWLQRMTNNTVQLILKAYTEHKNNSIEDAISMEVEGVGEGYGYQATSGGERRRLDASFIFGLAEVAQAAHGSKPGTMFFDEVFESLDDDGVECVTEALEELAETRAVVVITHNMALAESLSADLRLQMRAGKVVSRGSR